MSISKFLVILSITVWLVSSPVLAQDTNVIPPAETAEIVPLLKMTKPKLIVVFSKEPAETFEDEVIAYGTKSSNSLPEVDKIVCKDLIVSNFGRYKNATRLKKKKKYCNYRGVWDARDRQVQKVIRDVTN